MRVSRNCSTAVRASAMRVFMLRLLSKTSVAEIGHHDRNLYPLNVRAQIGPGHNCHGLRLRTRGDCHAILAKQSYGEDDGQGTNDERAGLRHAGTLDLRGPV